MTSIGLVGKMCAGKTSIAKALAEKHGYARLSLAYEVKEDAAAMLSYWLDVYSNHVSPLQRVDIDVAWIEKNKGILRPFLQWLGTEWGRQLVGPETIWIDRFLLRVSKVTLPVVCDDLRFLNEADALRKAGFVIVRVVRDESERRASAGSQGIDGHASETEQQAISADIIIYNGSGRTPERCAEMILRAIEEGWHSPDEYDIDRWFSDGGKNWDGVSHD